MKAATDGIVVTLLSPPRRFAGRRIAPALGLLYRSHPRGRQAR